MRFLLRDRNLALVDAWRQEFMHSVDVEVSHGDIFDLNASANVSPANSFGFMDGGIDLVYSRRFGWDLQARLQETLRSEHDGELPVGQAIVIPTGDPAIPLLISAPTMRVPMDVAQTANAYLAFRAAIRIARQHNAAGSEPRIETLLCPGLGTAVGRMAPEVCARQMHGAYGTSHLLQAWRPVNLGQATDLHYRMLG